MNFLQEAFYAIKDAFGFEHKNLDSNKSLKSIELVKDESATEIHPSQGGVYSSYTDLFSVPTNEAELIKTYRALSLTADVERVLNEIRNEIFIFDIPEVKAIEVSFNETKAKEVRLSNSVLDKVRAEYNSIYNTLDFQRKGLEYFDRWFIDGRIFLQKVVNDKKANDGIQRVVLIDPLKIKRVVEYPKPDENGFYDLSQINTYYVFSEMGDIYSTRTSRFIPIKKDVIAYSDSGIYDHTNNMVLSELWKMIVPYNNMKMMEEALLIYRVVRSPERRAFYVNVGNLSKAKAEEYMQELMNRFKNKLVYDSRSGTIIDRKNVLSMVEDYWLPRRDDGKSTEIVTMPGGSNIGSTEDVDLFKKKFLDSSCIPASRFREDANSFVFGRTTEIARDEYRFKKYLDRLRNRFIVVIEDLLRTQLLLKKIIVDEDWERVKKSIIWIYAEDNNFVQWKEAEVLNSQIETLSAIDQLVGKYFDRKWVLKNVMNKSDEIIDKMLEDAAADMPPADDGTIPTQPASPLTGPESTETEEESESTDET